MQNDNTEIEFDSELDLHSFSPHDTAYLVDYFIKRSKEKGLSEVWIIHGKGRSVKKNEVLNILKNHPLIESFSDEGHNWGKTHILLKQDK